jgi:hypothetical protein
MSESPGFVVVCTDRGQHQPRTLAVVRVEPDGHRSTPTRSDSKRGSWDRQARRTTPGIAATCTSSSAHSARAVLNFSGTDGGRLLSFAAPTPDVVLDGRSQVRLVYASAQIRRTRSAG